MMRFGSSIVLALCAMWLWCQPAFAERRIALVIGNSAYERVPRLTNPANDATAMANMFKKAGFDVVDLKLDLKAIEMRRALRDFADNARDADYAIIYYAGHGIEIDGTNYLVPVDAVLQRDIDAFDEAIPLDRLLSVIETARQLRLVILDACRDNPFAKTIRRPVASRSIERGLAKIEPDSPNTLVAFAAKAGSTADDGDTKNSPFTTALVKYLPTPGLDLRKAFGFVRDDVLKVTNYKQEPFIYGSLGGNDVPLVPAPPAPPVDPNAGAREDYQLTSQINMVSAWDSFLAKYPTGFYSDLARAQRDKLIAAQMAATEQARLAAEKARADDARLAAQKKAADDAKAASDAKKAAEAKAAEAERIRIVAEKAKSDKAAADKAAADKAAADKAAAEKVAADKAAEDARIAAAKAKAAEAARVAEAAKAAEQAKAAQAAREAAEREKAQVDAKAAEAARAKAAQSAPNQQMAAVLPGDARLGHDVNAAQQRAPSGCAGAPAQTVAARALSMALSLSEECSLKPKDAFKECQNCPEMVVVPSGEFLMGSARSEIDNGRAAANEAPQHKVQVTERVAIGRFEVTRDQFADFVAATGYRVSGRCMTFEENTPKERENRSYMAPGYAQQGNHPAVCVSWNDARAYVDWLSRATGKPYRLPSEAEFEYAARAGGSLRYAFTDDPADLCRFVNGADQAARKAGLPEDGPYMACTDGYPFTAPVGAFAANAFGLHDVIGNVWEWTADCYADDYTGAGANSVARVEPGCAARTVRGGDWFSSPASLRPAVRAKASPDAHNDDIGFRVARTLVH